MLKPLNEITGEARKKLERSYCRAYKKFHMAHFAKFRQFPAGSDLVKFRQDFMQKNKISTGI